MRILYGVVGEGMGHATRSRVVIEHLLGRGHELRVVVSGRAHRFLMERLQGLPKLRIDQIEGLSLSYFGNRLDKSQSLFENLKNSPRAVRRNVEVYRQVVEDGFEPELVFSDFESWAALYAVNHFLPVISIDNMQIINRCRHDSDVTGFDFRLAKLAVKMKIPGAYHYLVTSFFFPPVQKKRTTLLPPILRPEILAARREPGEHVLVYQTAASNQELVPTLRRLRQRFRVYGMGRSGQEDNVTLCDFSEHGFVEDLRTARAVIAGGGFSLLSEAVSLHVPVLSVPVEGQYEQELNARYLEKLGYGAWVKTLDEDVIRRFLARVDDYDRALAAYPRRDNSLLFGCVDELVERRRLGKRPATRLAAPALGSYEASARRP